MTDKEADLREALSKQGAKPDQINWMVEMEKWREEELLPELEPFVIEEGVMGRMLKHPLVFEIPLMLPGRANLQYRQKKQMLDDAVEQEDWHRVVFLHERPYRLDALIDYVVGRDEGDIPLPLSGMAPGVRKLAADVWRDSENIHQHIDDWSALFSEWNPGDPLILCDDEEGWGKLPDPLTVYRAGIDDGGWSWTLDPKIAQFFAQRFGANNPILSGTVEKQYVFGYLAGRGESEVLVQDGTVEV